jgi:hypothetical protein
MDEVIKSIILDAKLEKYEKLSAILKYLFVDIAKISQDNYYILGSFGLRKYRIISDLDINLDYDEFLKLENVTEKGMGNLQFYHGQIRWFFDLTKEYNKLTREDEKDFSIEAFQKKPTEGFPDKTYSLSYLKEKGGLELDSNGHQFFNLNTLLRWKQQMNRDKDKPDIELIQKLLSQSGKGYNKTLKRTLNKVSKKASKKASKKVSKKASKKVSKKASKKVSKKTSKTKKNDKLII